MAASRFAVQYFCRFYVELSYNSYTHGRIIYYNALIAADLFVFRISMKPARFLHQNCLQAGSLPASRRQWRRQRPLIT